MRSIEKHDHPHEPVIHFYINNVNLGGYAVTNLKKKIYHPVQSDCIFPIAVIQWYMRSFPSLTERVYMLPRIPGMGSVVTWSVHVCRKVLCDVYRRHLPQSHNLADAVPYKLVEMMQNILKNKHRCTSRLILFNSDD